MLVELVILFALHADDKNEAEQLFRKMETKLTGAKSLECTYEAKSEGGTTAGRYTGSFKGSLALAEGNKSRLEMSGKFEGEEVRKTTDVSDGERIVSLAEDGTEANNLTAPKWNNDAHRAQMARSAFFLFVIGAPFGGSPFGAPKVFKADEELKVSDFKLGKKEKVGDKEAQAVQYNLNVKQLAGPPYTVTVWIDTKTNLPLKRELTRFAEEAKSKSCVTEIYSKISIDEKIDPKKFELPKD
jgi:outer membrane lipoprotein-sorting protein